MALSHKILAAFFAVTLMFAVAIAAYLQEPMIIGAPFLILGIHYLVQHPQHLLYLLLFFIPWSIEFNFIKTLGTDLPDEPLMLLLSLAVIIMLIHRRHQINWKQIHPLMALILLQFIWSTITVVTSTDPVLSVKYLAAKSWYLLAFVAAPVLLLNDKERLRNAVFVLLVSMILLVICVQFRHAQHNFTFNWIDTVVRPFFRNHVNYSALLVFMVPIQIAIIRLSASKTLRILISITLIITLGAIYFSYARGAWLAVIAGFIANLLLRKKLLFPVFIFFFAFFAGAVLYLKSNDRYLNFSNDFKSTIWHSNFREHLIATYQLKDASSAERFYRWVAGVRMIEDSWKTGLGPSTFYKNYKSYTQPAFKTWVSSNKEQSTVHNYFLLMIIEQGALGLILFLLLLALVFWYLQKIYHRTSDEFWKRVIAVVASVMMMQCVLNFLSDLVETDKVGSVFYLCIAIVMIADAKTKKEKLPLTGY